MKRIFMLITCVIMCGVILAGCGTSGKGDTPDTVKGVEWTTYDYSFYFDNTNNCKGKFTFDGKRYDVTVKFDGGTVVATDSSNKELWNGLWQYKADNKLYIYDVVYNTEDFKELKACYSTFFDMRQEKADK